MRLPALCVLVVSLPVFGDQVIFRAQDWTVSAPDQIDCSKPPSLVVKGPATLFGETNRSKLQEITVGLAEAISRSCPSLREVLLLVGRTQRIVTLPQRTALPAKQEPKGEPQNLPPSVPSGNFPEPPRQPIRGTPVQVPDAPGVSPRAVAPGAISSISHFPDRRLSALESAKSIEDKCELLLKWLGRLPQESPIAGGGRYVNHTVALNLYRDEDFVQIFGQPFDKTSAKWRTDIHAKVISRCQGRMASPGIIGRRPPMTTYAAQFLPYTTVLDSPFLGEESRVSGEVVIEHITKARQARASMDKLISELGALPAAAKTFRDLGRMAGVADGRRSPPSEIDQSRLWKSELDYMTAALHKRRSEVAVLVVRTWMREMDAVGGSLDDVRKLVHSRAELDDVFAATEGSIAAEASAKLNEQLNVRIGSLVEKRVAELAALPATLAGAKQTLIWQAAFERDFKTFADRESVLSAASAYSQQRIRILNGALPEWKSFVNVLNPTEEQLQARAATLKEIFGTQKEHIAVEYQT